jgi:hypothetical protein
MRYSLCATQVVCEALAEPGVIVTRRLSIVNKPNENRHSPLSGKIIKTGRVLNLISCQKSVYLLETSPQYSLAA